LDLAFESLKDQLFGRLHGVLRKQLFGSSDNSQDLSEEPSDAKFSQNSAALVSSCLETLNAENN
jgi:arogenate dehydrogenase (NADP+)